MGMSKTAIRVINRYGTAGKLIRNGEQTGPAYNPTFGPDIEFPITVALVDYSQRDLSGTLVETTDRKALVSIDGFNDVPTIADRLEVSGETYQIISLSRIETKGTVHYWRLQVRQ